MARKTARRIGVAAVVTLALFAAAIVVTARPGDRSLWPPPAGAPTVGIFLVSHGYHAGIAIPRAPAATAASRHGWTALADMTGRFAAYDWLEIGWGDEGFYRTVPTAASLTFGVGLRALFWPDNPSVLHVVGLHAPPDAIFRGADLVAIDLGEAGFTRMLAGIDASFARDTGGRPTDLGPGLYGASRFFGATGRFHLLRVCNHWVADLLDAAGLPTAPIPSVLPQGLLMDLKWRAGLVPAARPGVPLS